MDQVVTVEDLKKRTDEFFKRHWNQDEIKIDPITQWKWDNWYLKGTLPNGDSQGCYALMSKENVVYIGVGASRGGGKYAGWGLGARVTRYFRLIKGQGSSIAEREYEPAENMKDKNITMVMTIGFPKNYGYLALALESYLLNTLATKHNVNRSGGF